MNPCFSGDAVARACIWKWEEDECDHAGDIHERCCGENRRPSPESAVPVIVVIREEDKRNGERHQEQDNGD
jgi:hypothetical protein